MIKAAHWNSPTDSSFYQPQRLRAVTADPGVVWAPDTETLTAWFRSDTLQTSGSNVTSWTDLGPNGYHATPFGAGFPVLVTNALNGKPIVRFSSTNRFLKFATGVNPVSESTPYTIVVVAKATAQLASNNYSNLLALGAGTSKTQQLFFANSAGYWPVNFGGGKGATSGNVPGIPGFDYYTNYFVLVTTYDGTGNFNSIPAFGLRNNNVAQSAINGSAANTTQSINLIGAYDNLSNFPFAGDVAEIIIAPTAWSATTLASLNTYMYTRYGLGETSAWQPKSINQVFSWHRSQNCAVSAGTALAITDLTNNGRDVDCNSSPTAKSNPPSVVTGQLNGKTTLRMTGASDGGAFLYDSAVETFCDPSLPFGLAWVVKGAALTSGDYTALLQMAGATDALAFTIYYLNLSPYPTISIMSGPGPSNCPYVGPTNPVTYTDAHSVVLNYNGGGMGNTSSFTMYINGVSVPLSVTLQAGGNIKINHLGNQNDAPGVGIGDFYEMITAKDQITGSDFTNLMSYFNTQYGI